MADNNLKIQANVEMPSAKQINTQIKSLEKNLNKLKISGQFDPAALKSMTKQLDAIKASIKNAEKELAAQNNELQNSLSGSEKVFEKLQTSANETQTPLRGLAKTGSLIKEQFSEAVKSLSGMFSLKTGLSLIVSQAKNAISELKEADALLTQIGKTNRTLSDTDLANIGNASFDAASRYGKKASDYLNTVLQMTRSGYSNPAEIAELSTALQAASNLTADLASQYIQAADKAYRLGGSVESLTEILDGNSSITSRHAVDMAQLAQGMTAISESSARMGLDADETSAALATLLAVTKQSGSETAEAFRTILNYTGQISTADGGPDTKSLKQYEEACRALNISLTETKNGAESLRDPMEILKELSEAYAGLGANDIRRTDLLSSLGDASGADALNALLTNFSLYEEMLQEYHSGTGMLAANAEKNADSWEGALNRLDNSWTELFHTMADTDGITTGINALNGIISTIEKAVDTFGLLPIAASAAYAAISAKKSGGLIKPGTPAILLS